MKKYVAVFKVSDDFEPEETYTTGYFIKDNKTHEVFVPLRRELGETGPTGHWIDEYTERSDYGEFYICSRCGGLSKDKTKYCPDCGRRLLPFGGEESTSEEKVADE